MGGALRAAARGRSVRRWRLELHRHHRLRGAPGHGRAGGDGSREALSAHRCAGVVVRHVVERLRPTPPLTLDPTNERRNVRAGGHLSTPTWTLSPTFTLASRARPRVAAPPPSGLLGRE